MEVNQPERGIFKGIGKLENNAFINRKFFPKLRNQHQFEYTHKHNNDYKTCGSAFKKFDSKDYKYTRNKGSQNKTNFEMGTDSCLELNSENRRCFRKYESSLPPKPIKQIQQGIGINEYEERTGQKLIHYSTVSKEAFNVFNKNRESDSTIYKYTRAERFNPITGQFKGYNKTNFGFEDYAPNNNKNYKANNFTMIPSSNQKYDIITGRKLTHA